MKASKVGTNLRRLRQKRGLEQAELAAAAGSSQQTVSEIETGKRDPRESTLEKLAEALGVTVAEFFADDAPPNVPPQPKTPLTDEPPEDFDRRFAATDAKGAEVLRAKVDKEFGAIQQYVKQLEAAGVPESDFKIKRARARRREAQRRLYATTSRATDLALNAEFGRDRKVFDTVEAYVGKAEEVDAFYGEEDSATRVQPKAG